MIKHKLAKNYPQYQPSGAVLKLAGAGTIWKGSRGWRPEAHSPGSVHAGRGNELPSRQFSASLVLLSLPGLMKTH